MRSPTRARIILRGAVQGVGFRPFVYRLATELKLTGWVSNSTEGVCIEVEGAKEPLDEFVVRVSREHPRHASIHSFEYSVIDPAYSTRFEIRHSETRGVKRAVVLPDI